MSIDHGSLHIAPPTTADVKRQIVSNEKATAKSLDLIDYHLNEHARLHKRLSALTSEAMFVYDEPMTFSQVVKSLFGIKYAYAARRDSLRRSGMAVIREMDAVRTHLKEWGHAEAEKRMLAHYDDLKSLALLEINGDPEADTFYHRSTLAISHLRMTQRAIECLPSTERRTAFFESEGQDD